LGKRSFRIVHVSIGSDAVRRYIGQLRSNEIFRTPGIFEPDEATAERYWQILRTSPNYRSRVDRWRNLFCRLDDRLFIYQPATRNQSAAESTVHTNGWKFAVWTLISFTAAGIVTGLALGFATLIVSKVNSIDMKAFLFLSLGPPILITSFFVGELIHVGMTSYAPWGDAEREWLARAAGHHGRLALTWMVLAILIVGGSHFVFESYYQSQAVLSTAASAGGIAGVLTALLGRASATAATVRERYGRDWRDISATVILAVAVPLFTITAISFISAGVDAFILGRPQSFCSVNGPRVDCDIANPSTMDWHGLTVSIIIVTLVGLISSLAINPNRFSLHGIYRNRLIRTFLGASNPDRRPNPFTDFDYNDNIKLAQLWPNGTASNDGSMPRRVHHHSLLVINCALNIVATKELAWQERKAMSFIATPRWIGCGELDSAGSFRLADEYGGGMSLGTAMTISGAAASPNMGYHSSPSLSVLLTFFKVRLGAWLGNPGRAGGGTEPQKPFLLFKKLVMRLNRRVEAQLGLARDAYLREGPLFAIKPLVQEALGLTTDDKPYVYLSDGGHFENLGLYEMVRRRCHLILVSDAGCDPACTFEDLGNAVRKISVDLKVTVSFRVLTICPRKDPPIEGPCCAIGTIRYPESEVPGLLLYIKPAFGGTEPASVRSYAAINPAFPHEPTTDQWFGESQFEAYRALGEYIIRTIDGGGKETYGSIREFIDAVAVNFEAEHLMSKFAKRT
jgi:hypothetical protein